MTLPPLTAAMEKVRLADDARNAYWREPGATKHSAATRTEREALDACYELIRDHGKELVEALRKAERYDWLKANCGLSGSGDHYGAQVILYHGADAAGRYGILYTGPRSRMGYCGLDEAIDGTMKLHAAAISTAQRAQ